MNQKRFGEISEMIFKRLDEHEKTNTVCLLPMSNGHLDNAQCIPILEEVAEVFKLDVEELNEVLNKLINTDVLLLVPNKSGRWGLIIYSKR